MRIFLRRGRDVRGAVVGAIIAVALFGSSARSAWADGPTARIDSGTLAGTRDGTLDIYKGIPYAAPPVGALRWEPPARPLPWTGTRDATRFGPICPQAPRPDIARFAEPQAQNEDCLFLNVWTFDGAKQAPVMVWIHGGAFRFGSSSQRFYDGSDFARDGVILVSINYRLDSLGFFAHPALTAAAAPDAPLANYGLLDQLAALAWVQRNIAAFGGDPHNVTVFGESAGGESVLALLTLAQSKGLFAKAIVESGGGWSRTRTLGDAEKAGEAIAAAAGLGERATLDALRALPPEKLFGTRPKLGGLGPVEDGRLIREGITDAFAAGHFLQVPLIIGSNSYEASLMRSFRIPAAATASRIPAPLKPLYPGSEEEAASAFFTDAVMGAPARWIAEQASASAPAYLYRFSYVPTLRRGTVPGARHGSEIPFVFGAWPDLFNRFASADDRAMEASMHACWVAFARTGTPSCGGRAWPRFGAGTDPLMEFGATSAVETDVRKSQYDGLERTVLPAILSAK